MNVNTRPEISRTAQFDSDDIGTVDQLDRLAFDWEKASMVDTKKVFAALIQVEFE